MNAALQQPVSFSHKHHVGNDGIDCRYCHVSIGKSAFAGTSPLSTCTACHSQWYTQQQTLTPLSPAFESGVPLHWQRRHKLPDFVYFNHSTRIAKGGRAEREQRMLGRRAEQRQVRGGKRKHPVKPP
jgi:hypothetical protein